MSRLAKEWVHKAKQLWSSLHAFAGIAGTLYGELPRYIHFEAYFSVILFPWNSEPTLNERKKD